MQIISKLAIRPETHHILYSRQRVGSLKRHPWLSIVLHFKSATFKFSFRHFGVNETWYLRETNISCAQVATMTVDNIVFLIFDLTYRKRNCDTICLDRNL